MVIINKQSTSKWHHVSESNLLIHVKIRDIAFTLHSTQADIIQNIAYHRVRLK